MKAIMYHYVREHDDSLPFFKYLHVDNFVKQLDHFDKKFGYVNKHTFLDFVTHPSPLKTLVQSIKDKIILTFDDGFKDHYNYVLPELKKRDLWGIFYIPFSPFSSSKKKIIDVHRIHLLLGKYEAEDISYSINNLVNESMLSHNHVEEYHTETYIYQKNKGDVANHVKRVLNYFIDYKYREAVIDKLMEKYFPDEKVLIKKFYMTEEELINLSKQGMILGSHTVNHPVMSKLSFTEQEKEIRDSFDLLDSITFQRLRTFAYPYGGYHSFNEDTENLLEKYKCDFSFNVESKDIGLVELKRKQALPRYDCNEFPHGLIEYKFP